MDGFEMDQPPLETLVSRLNVLLEEEYVKFFEEINSNVEKRPIEGNRYITRPKLDIDRALICVTSNFDETVRSVNLPMDFKVVNKKTHTISVVYRIAIEYNYAQIMNSNRRIFRRDVDLIITEALQKLEREHGSRKLTRYGTAFLEPWKGVGFSIDPVTQKIVLSLGGRWSTGEIVK